MPLSLFGSLRAQAPTTKGVIELHGARVDEAVLGEENYGVVVRLDDGRAVMLAAASAAKRTEWLTVMASATTKPRSPPPPSGPRDKRVAQLTAERTQTKLAASMSIEKNEERTLRSGEEVGGLTRLQLLVDAQECRRQWSGFSEAELERLLDDGGLTLQRFRRREVVMKTGEAATFFGIVLQGTLAIDVGIKKLLKYPGHLLGEMALFNGGLRSADCIATSDGVVATMTFRQLEALKTSADKTTKAVAERLNLLLARCTLHIFLSERQASPPSSSPSLALPPPCPPSASPPLLLPRRPHLSRSLRLPCSHRDFVPSSRGRASTTSASTSPMWTRRPS